MGSDCRMFLLQLGLGHVSVRMDAGTGEITDSSHWRKAAYRYGHRLDLGSPPLTRGAIFRFHM